jgi:hypothetical protein
MSTLNLALSTVIFSLQDVASCHPFSPTPPAPVQSPLTIPKTVQVRFHTHTVLFTYLPPLCASLEQDLGLSPVYPQGLVSSWAQGDN